MWTISVVFESVQYLDHWGNDWLFSLRYVSRGNLGYLFEEKKQQIKVVEIEPQNIK